MLPNTSMDTLILIEQAAKAVNTSRTGGGGSQQRVAARRRWTNGTNCSLMASSESSQNRKEQQNATDIANGLEKIKSCSGNENQQQCGINGNGKEKGEFSYTVQYTIMIH